MMMFNPYKQLSSKKTLALAASAIVAVIFVWSLLSGLDLVHQSKLPAPWKVLGALSELAWNGTESKLLAAILSSCSRIIAASVLVMITGIPIGVLMGASPIINSALSPFVDPFRSAPIVAFLPILVMWLGIDELMKVAFLWLGAVVYLVPMTRDAIKAVPRDYFVSILDMGGSSIEALRFAVLPIALPRILDGLTVSVSIMWTYITVAEVIHAQSGLGALIQSGRRLGMDKVFASIFVIIVIALITYRSMITFKRLLCHWADQ